MYETDILPTVLMRHLKETDVVIKIYTMTCLSYTCQMSRGYALSLSTLSTFQDRNQRSTLWALIFI